MLQNRDIVKEIRAGMLVAVLDQTFPCIGKVTDVSPNPHPDSDLQIHWMIQEKASHKPKWLRYFKLSQRKDAMGTIKIKDVVLYGFDLTEKGALKKKSREYLLNSSFVIFFVHETFMIINMYPLHFPL